MANENALEVKELPISFEKIELRYANQTMIQLTENDLAIGFGCNSFGSKGEEIIEFQTMVRMSHNQAIKLHEHLGHVIEELKKLTDNN